MDDKISMVDVLSIHTAAPFKDLFPIREAVLNEIAEDMKINGFDTALPIVIWAGHKVTVVDGHTRLAAAIKVGLSKVPIKLKEFASEDDALKYAIKSQRNRRNLTDEELWGCVRELDKRKIAGRRSELASREANSGKSAAATADLLGISRAKVEKIRAISDHASEKTKEAVAKGEMTINKAYNVTMRRRREKEADAASDEKSAAEIREERMTAMVTSIAELIRKRMEREVQEFPELRYTEAERRKLCEDISASAAKIVAEMLPSETN